MMPRPIRITMILCLVAAAVTAGGCSDLLDALRSETAKQHATATADAMDDAADGLAGDRPATPADEQFEDAADAATTIGNALNPVTGGLSGLVVLLGVNGLRLAREVSRRGRAIAEIDAEPSTPPAAEQVTSDAARYTIGKVTGASP